MSEVHGPANMDQTQIKLKWTNYVAVFSDSLQKYYSKSTFADAMIACEGRIFMVHRIILSMCSDYFSEIFEVLPNDNTRPVIVLNEAHADNVAAVLTYLYCGEVTIPKLSLPSIVKLMKWLKLKGIFHFQELSDKSDSSQISTGTKESSETLGDVSVAKKKIKPDTLKRKSGSSHSGSKKARMKATQEKQLIVFHSGSSLSLTNTTTTTTTCASAVPTGGIAVINSLQSAGSPVVSIPISSLSMELQASANASLKSMPLLAAHLMGKPNHAPKPLPPISTISVTHGKEDSSYRFLPATSESDPTLLLDVKEEVKEEPLTLGPDDPISQDDDEDYWNGDDEGNSLSNEYIQPVSPSMTSAFHSMADSHTLTVSPCLNDPHTLTVSSSSVSGAPSSVLPPSTTSNLIVPMMTVRIPVAPLSPSTELPKEAPPPASSVEAKTSVAPVRSSHVLPQILPKPIYGTASYVTSKEGCKKSKQTEEAPKPEQANYTIKVKSFSSLTHSKDTVTETKQSSEPAVAEIPHNANGHELPSGVCEKPQKAASSDTEMNQIPEDDIGLKEMMQLLSGESTDDHSINFIAVDSEKRRNPPYLINSNRITTKNAEPVKFRVSGAKPKQVVSICLRYSEEKFKNYPVIVCRLHQTFQENSNFRVSTSGLASCVYDIENGHPTAYLTLCEDDANNSGDFEFFVTFICLNSCHKEYGKKMELILKLLDASRNRVLRRSRHEVRVCKNVKRDYKEALQGEDPCLKVLVRPDSFLYPDEHETPNLTAGDVKAQLMNPGNRSQSHENNAHGNNALATLPGVPVPPPDGQPQEFYLIRLPNSKKGKMLLNLVKEFDRSIPDLETVVPMQTPEERCQDT